MESSRYSLIAAAVGRLSRQARAAITGMVVPFVVGAAADLIVLAGVGMVAYGCGLAFRPLGFIVGGIFAIIIGVRGLQPPAPASPEPGEEPR